MMVFLWTTAPSKLSVNIPRSLRAFCIVLISMLAKMPSWHCITIPVLAIYSRIIFSQVHGMSHPMYRNTFWRDGGTQLLVDKRMKLIIQMITGLSGGERSKVVYMAPILSSRLLCHDGAWLRHDVWERIESSNQQVHELFCNTLLPTSLMESY